MRINIYEFLLKTTRILKGVIFIQLIQTVQT